MTVHSSGNRSRVEVLKDLGPNHSAGAMTVFSGWVVSQAPHQEKVLLLMMLSQHMD